MICGEHRVLAGVPILMMFREAEAQLSKRGTILFYHGLFASKDSQHKELYSLAEHGFLAVGVDVVGHGERRFTDLEQRFSAQNPDSETALDSIIGQTVAEIPSLIDALSALNLSNPDRIGIGGISLGGYITYQALLQEPRLSVATPILGSPRTHCPRADSPFLHPNQIFPVALLSQNAGQDANVNPAPAREFYQKLLHYYQTAPTRLRHVEYPGVGHFMPENVWLTLWSEVLSWFNTFL